MLPAGCFPGGLSAPKFRLQKLFTKRQNPMSNRAMQTPQPRALQQDSTCRPGTGRAALHALTRSPSTPPCLRQDRVEHTRDVTIHGNLEALPPEAVDVPHAFARLHSHLFSLRMMVAPYTPGPSISMGCGRHLRAEAQMVLKDVTSEV